MTQTIQIKKRALSKLSKGVLFLLFSAAIALISPSQSLAAVTLTTNEADIPVYSGPGEQFRVLAVLPEKSEVKASSQMVSSSAGRFYRVLIKLGEKQKAIGFIPATANVRIGSEEQETDDLTKYGAVALISKAGQITYSSFKDQQYAWTLGYMHYLSPGFYVRGFAGQWTAPAASATIAGGEIGNDALLVGSISGFVSYSLGLISPGATNTMFAGSSKLNILMMASLGLRYNLEGFASFALAATQAVAYNQNNSLVTNGVQASLEVGL